MISRNTIDAIQQLPIKDVVDKFYKGDLKRMGSSYRGHSPWSDEKTPSFYVVPAKNIFKDFSSGHGGGAVNFVMLTQNLSYPIAVKEIAKEFSIKIEEDANGHDPKEAESIEELYKINRSAARKYNEVLWNKLNQSFCDFDDKELLKTIFRRWFTEETICQWQIGYAPKSYDFLYSIAKEKALCEPCLELGLLRKKDNIYDSFRHRIIFPIHDERGRIVGFGGRRLNEEDNPKYLNSSESRIFIKSKVLYGLHFAIHAIRKSGYARLVEGYTDVISMHQAGFTNTVGSCGTSLTTDQVKLLKRYTNKVIVIMDGDDPGQNAADRCIDLFLDEGFQTDLVPLPEGKDPDDFVRMFDRP